MNISARRLRRAATFVVILLAVEFLDEFVFGAREAAWPTVRDDLHLTYEQVGLLLSVPGLIAVLIEPVIGILGDVWKRHLLILGGGALFTAGLLMTAFSHNFAILLVATIVLFPASGAMVGLSQSTLMDTDPKRHEQNMARWTFAGSVGVLAGAAMLGAALASSAGWRGFFLGASALSFVLVFLLGRQSFPRYVSPVASQSVDLWTAFKSGLLNAWRAMRRPEVLRWLILLECADLLMDVLYSYLALYFVDVVGASEEQATLAVTVWTGFNLLGDLLIIPLLERVGGLHYLRMTALVETILFSAFLLVPGWLPKLLCIALVALANSGWYSTLKANQYSSMPGQSGTVLAIDSLFSLVHSLIPLCIGLVAERFGLGSAMWLLLLGPVVLVIGLPRHAAKPIV